MADFSESNGFTNSDVGFEKDAGKGAEQQREYQEEHCAAGRSRSPDEMPQTEER